MAAWLRHRWQPVLAQRQQVRVLGRLWSHLAPRGGLSLGEGDPLQVDGSFHHLKQQASLFGVELKTPLAGVAPPARLEGEGGLKEKSESG